MLIPVRKYPGSLALVLISLACRSREEQESIRLESRKARRFILQLLRGYVPQVFHSFCFIAQVHLFSIRNIPPVDLLDPDGLISRISIAIPPSLLKPQLLQAGLKRSEERQAFTYNWSLAVVASFKELMILPYLWLRSYTTLEGLSWQPCLQNYPKIVQNLPLAFENMSAWYYDHNAQNSFFFCTDFAQHVSSVM